MVLCRPAGSQADPAARYGSRSPRGGSAGGDSDPGSDPGTVLLSGSDGDPFPIDPLGAIAATTPALLAIFGTVRRGNGEDEPVDAEQESRERVEASPPLDPAGIL